jgi:hypothetical protein
MPRDHVYKLFKDAKLKPNLLPRAENAPNEEGWAVCETNDPSSPACDIEGSVLFRNNVLIQASVRWGPKAESASAVVDALIGAAHDFSKQGLSHCDIGTDNQDKPDFFVRRMQIRCGGHHAISAFVWQHPDGLRSAEVQEIISEKEISIDLK